MLRKHMKFSGFKIFLVLGILFSVTCAFPFSVQAYKNYRFDLLMGKAQDNFRAKNYSLAVNLWNKAIALSPREKLQCEQYIARASALDESRINFEKAQQRAAKNQYIEAIEYYNKIKPEDRDYFDTAQLKILEHRNTFIEDQLAQADRKVMNNDINGALELLDSAKASINDRRLQLAIEKYRFLAENKIEEKGMPAASNIEKITPDTSAAVKAIPVLMYHSIDSQKGNLLKLPREKFYAQMSYLKAKGYTTLSLDELYSCLTGRMELPSKPVVITLDDGYSDNYSNAYPVLKEMNFKATIFMIANYIDSGKGFLNSAQIKELVKNGVAVESHTLNHEDLSTLNYEAQFKILKSSREKLQLIENRPVLYLAYPVGKYNTSTERAARDAGYLSAFTTRPGFARLKNGLYFLHRIRINSDLSLEGFKWLL